MLRSDRVTRIAAFANAAQDTLPPLDTLDAIFQTEAGTQGVFQLSFTSNLHGTGWEIVGDNGSISVMDWNGTVDNTTVTTRFRDREPEVRQIPIEGLGVPDEVLAWGKALATGKWNDRQRPEEALADLELVCFPIFLCIRDADGTDGIDVPEQCRAGNAKGAGAPSGRSLAVRSISIRWMELGILYLYSLLLQTKILMVLSTRPRMKHHRSRCSTSGDIIAAFSKAPGTDHISLHIFIHR